MKRALSTIEACAYLLAVVLIMRPGTVDTARAAAGRMLERLRFRMEVWHTVRMIRDLPEE